jgi:hypothetical protein
MLVNVNQVLKTLDGQTMKDNDGKGNAIDATVKMAIVNAVLSPVERESGIDKVKKFNLAQKIYGSDEIDLTAEEISLIKERVGDTFAPIIVGQVWNILEGKNGP